MRTPDFRAFAIKNVIEFGYVHWYHYGYHSFTAVYAIIKSKWDDV